MKRRGSTLSAALQIEISDRVREAVEQEEMARAFSTSTLDAIVRRATRKAMRELIIRVRDDAQKWLDSNPDGGE